MNNRKKWRNRIIKLCQIILTITSIFFMKEVTYAITLNDYNNYIEYGRLYNLGSNFDARYNPNVLKYRKYGHFTYDGVISYPSGNPEMPFNEVNGDRILADQAISTDKTYKITGQFDYDGMDYSYYDIEGLNSYEINRYEFQSRLNSLVVTDRKSEDQGYGAYNFRAGKNIISFINFAYDFYKNQSGEIRVGCETIDDLAARGITSGGVCPMEYLKGFEGVSHTNVDAFNYDIFNVLFRKCTTDWEYQGNREIVNSGSIFANLQYYYMAIIYLQPGLRKFRSLRPNDFNSMDENDNAAFLSMMFERYGGRPIITDNYEARNLVNRLGEVGEYEILPALIDDKLGMSVGERIYRYMIEIKWKNNPEALARWISEYNEVYGEYDMLNAEDYAIFKKACDEGYRKHASSRSADTALDFGYVLTPEDFESRISFDEAVAEMANHFQHNFQDSQFYKNRNNAEYVAKTYAMAKAMCENDAFTDITDIYACIVNLVEHSYGYDSCEILLTDTQVVHLMAPLTDGDYDTDKDNLLDRQELSHEENVNISNLLEEYINYNRLPEEEANKLRADPYIKMWAYKSNPALPDTDFDGRNDDFDIHKPLENRQVGKMSTLNYDEVNFDYSQDYRYFFMPSTQYYYELSEMSMVLANMVNKKSGINRRWSKDTLYVTKIANDSGAIETESYRERYNTNGITGYMNYIGLDDIEEHDMSHTNNDSNVCRYAIGHRDVIYSLGRTKNVMRNVIAISIGDIEAKAAELYANFDGHAGREGSNTEYHHIGFDIVANRILEVVERYASRYAPEYQKVYWITGEAGGGSVANLLAQKLIKKYGNKNIYCYTFQALNTINCNNIPAVQRISNEPYGSIFNLYNDDNELIKLYSNDNNFYKYGINKHVAISSSDEYISLWQNATGEKYNKTTKNNNAERFKEWLSESDDGVVSGFSFTEVLNIFVDTTREMFIRFTAYFRAMGRTSITVSNLYADPREQEISNVTVKKVTGDSYEPSIQSSDEISGIIDAIGTAQDRKADSVNPNAYIDDDNDPRNGYKFMSEDRLDLNYNELNLDSIVKNTANVHTIKVNNSNYAYSNYTMRDDEVFCDIDFTKFWNITAEEQSNINNIRRYFKSKASSSNAAHMHLFDIKAGDFGEKYDDNQKSGKTLATYGSCFGKDRINNVINELEYTDIFDVVKNSNGVVAFDKDIKKDNSIVGKFLTIDGRIVAAFPFAALVGDDSDSFKKVGNLMHKFNNYYHPETGETEGRYKGTGANDGGNSIYRYVDVVFEKDGNKKHQYVVPFIIIDAKALHYRPNIEGFFGTFVDNRYGQVYQVKDDLRIRNENGNIKNIKVEEPMLLYRDNSDKKEYHLLSEEHALNAELSGWQKIVDANYLEYYPDKDEVREINRISPIEPYVSNKDENEVVLSEKIGNVAVTSSLLLTPKDKIISMRVYKHKFDKNDQRHFLNIREDRSKIEPDDTDDRKKVLNETEQNVVRNVIINYSQ